MKNKKLIIIIFAFSSGFFSFGQDQFFIELNDSNFVEHQLNGIDLVDNLEDGQYFVYYDYPCGERDTLLSGRIKNSKRDGIWFYYDLDVFPCSGMEFLSEIRYYEQGFIRKVIDSYGRRELVFLPNSQTINDINLEKRIYKNDDGKIIRIDYIKKGKLKKRKKY